MVNVNNNIWQAYNYLSDSQNLLYLNNGLHHDNSQAYQFMNEAKAFLHDIILSWDNDERMRAMTGDLPMPIIPEEEGESENETHI